MIGGTDMVIELNELRGNIDRVYQMHGANRGLEQSLSLTEFWKSVGWITGRECRELRSYSGTRYREAIRKERLT